jgi:PIN domain nuclease of toxin-antitoxin system
MRDFTTGQAHRAAELHRATRRLGLSFGDRACLALGLEMESPILTADRTWGDLDLGVEIRLAR